MVRERGTQGVIGVHQIPMSKSTLTRQIKAEIAPEWDAFIASVQRPAALPRIKKLMDRGFHKPGEAENRLDYFVGQLGT